VDEATGYEKVRPQNALQRYLEILVRKELAAWAKKFPDEFYENIYRLKGWPWPGMGKNRYSVVAYYTRDLVYERLGPGLLNELESKSPKNGDGSRESRLHQWLTEDVGDPLLAQHLHSLVMLQRLALANGYGWQRFLNSVNLVLPKRGKNAAFGRGGDDLVAALAQNGRGLRADQAGADLVRNGCSKAKFLRVYPGSSHFPAKLS
jgi:hypothetical protein